MLKIFFLSPLFQSPFELSSLCNTLILSSNCPFCLPHHHPSPLLSLHFIASSLLSIPPHSLPSISSPSLHLLPFPPSPPLPSITSPSLHLLPFPLSPHTVRQGKGQKLIPTKLNYTNNLIWGGGVSSTQLHKCQMCLLYQKMSNCDPFQ